MKSLRDQAIARVNNKRLANEKLRALAFEQAMEYDDVKKLYQKCRSLQFDIGQASYLHKDTTELNKQLKQSRTKLHALLQAYNINSNNLKPKFSCNICKDTGTVNNNDCDCLKREITQILLDNSGIVKEELPNFDDVFFKIFGDKEKQVQKIYQVFKDYCANLHSTNKKMVTISGNVGVGKTYLLECMVNECIKLGEYVVYTTAFNLNNDMLSYHTKPMDEKGDILRKYLECDLLCIDDLGTEPTLRNVTNEYLYLIINERLQNGKNTIITTNLNLDQIIDTYDERIFSRIANKNTCLLINMTGDDLRLKKIN